MYADDIRFYFYFSEFVLVSSSFARAVVTGYIELLFCCKTSILAVKRFALAQLPVANFVHANARYTSFQHRVLRMFKVLAPAYGNVLHSNSVAF